MFFTVRYVYLTVLMLSSASNVSRSCARNANCQLAVPNARDFKNDIYLMITVNCDQALILNMSTVKQNVNIIVFVQLQSDVTINFIYNYIIYK